MPLRVRYAETDAAGLAHHGSYPAWLEAARVEWLRAGGVSYADLEKQGYHLAVVEMRLRYIAPARFDDLLHVRIALVRARSREALFDYEIVSASEHPRQIATATTRHLSLHQGRLAPLPPALRAQLDTTGGAQGARAEEE
jgi:acyl-CoA thioester hydrolase